jgi:hypothetical protein
VYSLAVWLHHDLPMATQKDMSIWNPLHLVYGGT